MKSPIPFAVLTTVFLSPLFSFAYYTDPFTPGTSPSNPIYVEVQQNPWDATRQATQNDWQKQQNLNNAQDSYWQNAKQQHKESQQQSQPQVQYVPYPVYQQTPTPAPALTLDQQCKKSYGSLSYGANNSCYCTARYDWAPDKKSCVKATDVADLQRQVQNLVNDISALKTPPKSKDQLCKDSYGKYSMWTRDTNSAGDYECGCVNGYSFAKDGTVCMPVDQMCRTNFGQNTYWDNKANRCTCNVGHDFNGESCAPVTFKQTASALSIVAKETGNIKTGTTSESGKATTTTSTTQGFWAWFFGLFNN